MVKKYQKSIDKDGNTQVLYKKSNSTIQTCSRTCSGTSQLTRSGTSYLKKKVLCHKDLFIEGGKVKRDLSMETDVCVLRRYCLRKRNKMSNKEASSAKSRYSNFTEIDTIDEFNPDDSACGDNEHKSDTNYANPQFTVDVTERMIENFKVLLNNWIHIHLNDDSATKRKIQNIFHSVLHRIESKHVARTSCSTYILGDDNYQQKVKDKNIDTTSFHRYRKSPEVQNDSSSVILKKHSWFSIPVLNKNCKMISTLSIPRNFHKQKLIKSNKEKNFKFKVDKRQLRNLILFKNETSKIFPDCSSFDLLTVSIKSLIRRCANCEETLSHGNKSGKVGQKIFSPEPNCKSATTTTSFIHQCNVKVEVDKCSNKSIDITKNRNLIADPSLMDERKSNYSENVTLHMNTEKKFKDNSILTKTQNNARKRTVDVFVANKKDMETNCTHDDCTMTETKVSEFVTANIMIDKYVSSIPFPGETERTSCRTCFETSQILNEKDQSDPMITIDFIDHNLEFPHVNAPKKYKDTKYTNKNRNVNVHKRNIVLGKKIKKRRKYTIAKLSSCLKFEKIQHKDFTYLFKKVNSKIQESNEFLKHFQDIFKYFANYDSAKNLKLDVHVNVFPMFDNEDETLNISNDLNGNSREIRTNPTIVYKVDPVDNITNLIEVDEETCKDCTSYSFDFKPEIIPLLDSAASHAKYICTRQNSFIKDEEQQKKSNFTDRCTMTLDFEISQEIGELKAAIKDLAMTAEQLFKEHLDIKKKSRKSKDRVEATTLCNINYTGKMTSTQYSERNPILPKRLKSSKGIQFSSGFARNQRLQSGLKLKKLPKKSESHTWESQNQLVMKSTSYRIIDSESILKVTDMTSTANDVNQAELIDQGLTCSLPKTRSLYEVSTEKPKLKQKQNVMAYYCDGINRKTGDVVYCIKSPCPSTQMTFPKKCKKKQQSVYTPCIHRACSCTKHKCPQHQCQQHQGPQHARSKHSVIEHTSSKQSCNLAQPCNNLIVPTEMTDSDRYTVKCYKCNELFSSESVNIDIEDRYRVIRVKKRKEITFGEGLFYCTLMWIPAILILVSFYILVLRPRDSSTRSNRTKTTANITTSKTSLATNLSELYIRLADLGF